MIKTTIATLLSVALWSSWTSEAVLSRTSPRTLHDDGRQDQFSIRYRKNYVEDWQAESETRYLQEDLNITCLFNDPLEDADFDGIVDALAGNDSLVCIDYEDILQYGTSEMECRWNDLYFQNICLSDITTRGKKITILEQEEADDDVFLIDYSNKTVRLDILFDDEPSDLVWEIQDFSTGEAVALSPFYNSSLANTNLIVEFPLRSPGTYTFIAMDASGDGIGGDGYIYGYDVDLDFLLFFFDSQRPFEIYDTKNFIL